MSESILTNTKKILGLAEDYTAFDFDIIVHINAALSVLTQIGVGPTDGMMIEDATAEWSLLGSDVRVVNACKQYVYLSVRSVFDPANSSYGVEAMQKQIDEQVWRINTMMEETIWTDPDPDPDAPDVPVGGDQILDGGAP